MEKLRQDPGASLFLSVTEGERFVASSGGTGEAQQQQRQGLQTGLRGSDTVALPTMESSYTLPEQGGLCGATQAQSLFRTVDKGPRGCPRAGDQLLLA